LLLSEPEVRPEVRFDKNMFPTRARTHGDEMLKFHCDEFKGKCFRATKENKKKKTNKKKHYKNKMLLKTVSKT
jgi:hypothetical protein